VLNFVNHILKKMNNEALQSFYSNHKKTINFFGIFIVVLLFVIFIIILSVFIFGPDRNNRNVGDGFTTLPGDLEEENAGVNGDELNGIKAEDIMFGHFYEKNKDSFRPSATKYELPINIKSDAENYYDVSRKIDLNNYTEDINKNGFKIINNPFPQDNDFFALYNRLLKEEIPIVITSDFLMYYYQNNLKNIFDEIERNTFYKNVWDIYKDLFDKASSRYEERLARLGVSNDSVLEGQRLETAYLAIVLKLLTPGQDQISEQKSLNNYDKFSKTDALYYDFILPEYLERDVNQELSRIRGVHQIEKSPVFLYPRDYKEFTVPAEYKNDAKLHNFYLATKWLNSLFPLYFRSSDCPDCLLDKNDWLINMASAIFLSKDMSDSQLNKNKWAIIYKFLSYFSGLRQDLTYLEYDRAFSDVYGKAYVIENIFARKNFSDIDVYKIQAKIAENKFSEIEGSYSRKQGKNPVIGMRMLQESFWPNEYIFDRLTGKNMTSTAVAFNKKKQLTACRSYRCSATGLDIINIKNPLENNELFVRESDYTLYDTELQNLRNYMAGFNVFTWNTNIYWSTLDIVNVFLAEDESRYPVFMQGENWLNEKKLNTALGSWVNIHVPKDVFTVASGNKNDFSTLQSVCDLPNYIDPSLDYLYENISRNNMLLDMMDILNVSRDTNLAALDIEEANSMFERIVEINKKSLSGDLLNHNDCMYIRSMVNNKKIKTTTKKSFNIHLGKKVMHESIDGVKMMIVVFKSGDDKIIAMGPVYNYRESIY